MVRKGNRTIIIPSQSYLDYKKEVMPQLRAIKKKQKIKTIADACNIKMVFYRGDRRRCDLSNLQEALLDLLVDAEIIEDDNYNIVSFMDGSTVYYDKENPRTEVEITIL